MRPVFFHLRMFSLGLMALVLLALAPSIAVAQTEPQPNVTGRDGPFGVLALITADPGWRNEWGRTDGQPPRLVPSPRIGVGDTAQVLVVFSGATPVGSRLLIECSVDIALPDGSVHQLPAARCFDHPLDGPADAARLLDVDLGIRVEPSDPPGLYLYVITATDLGSGRNVRLTASVEVIGGSGA